MSATSATEKYLYASARIRSLENRLVGKERIERLLDRKTSGEILSSLGDCGYQPVVREDGSTDTEETLLGVLTAAYHAVAEAIPDPALLRFLLYRYDCHNLKTAIKGFLGEMCFDGMLFPLGTVPPEEVAAMPRKGDFTGLPDAMRTVAPDAMEAFAKTKDPQKIDLLVDRAAFTDMLRAARETGCAYAERLVCTEIDYHNFLMTLRVIRMKNGRAAKALLGEALLSGGSFPTDTLLSLVSEHESRFYDALRYSEYARFVRAAEAEDTNPASLSLAVLERIADDCYADVVREAKMVPFGPEVAIGYLVGAEIAAKNVRILLAGKDAGLPAELLRERVRDSYV